MTTTNKNLHLTLDERIAIQNGIHNGDTKANIAASLGKDPSTIGKEIKKHRSLTYKSTLESPCANYKKCTHNRMCKDCEDFVRFYCTRRDRSPGACNGCPNYKYCRYDKYKYLGDIAHKEYLLELKQCRQGINMTKDELEKLVNIIGPLIKQGLSPYAIIQMHPELNISTKTLYNYIFWGYLRDFGIADIDLRAKVGRRLTRKEAHKYKKREDHRYLKNRTYKDYQAYIQEYDPNIVQMDTVYNKADGPIMQTFKFMSYNFIFIVYHESRTSEAMIQGIDLLEEILGHELFKEEVEVLLTDRGTEFSNADGMERLEDNGTRRTHVFYCDPMASEQKGSLENNHKEIRYICPKNIDLTTLGFDSQDKANLLTMHINSVPKKKLKGKTPFEMMSFMSPKLYKKMIAYGIKPINKDEIILKPYLLK